MYRETKARMTGPSKWRPPPSVYWQMGSTNDEGGCKGTEKMQYMNYWPCSALYMRLEHRRSAESSCALLAVALIGENTNVCHDTRLCPRWITDNWEQVHSAPPHSDSVVKEDSNDPCSDSLQFPWTFASRL